MRAEQDWACATEATVHPYLGARGTESHGLKMLAGKLLVPVRNLAGELCSLQRIDAAGNKGVFVWRRHKRQFSYSARKNGCCCRGRRLRDGGKASTETTRAETVLCAFNCGNLLPVARAWREKKS